MSADPLLRVTDLTKHFPVRRGILFQREVGAVKAVDGISFDVEAGRTLGLVGESGCGKSTAARVITRVLEPTSGTVELDGRDITALSQRQLREVRSDVQMVFQDPYSSLNPRHTVGSIVGSGLRIQKVKTEHGVRREVQDLLERVGLNPEHYNRYPHEFSGGQRQRIGIARALALRPKLVVCDEPVSALDVSVQAQVITLLEDLQRDLGLTYVFIAHDLSVVRHVADRVAVMYLGRIMEIADRDDLYERALHPYTHALLSSAPIPDPDLERARERILLSGDVANPADPPPGCVFHTRCPKAQDVCREVVPPLEDHGAGHQVACHFPELTVRPELSGHTSHR